MPAHSRSKNGVAELVIGPRDFARARWLAYDPVVHAESPNTQKGRMDCRIKLALGAAEGRTRVSGNDAGESAVSE